MSDDHSGLQEIAAAIRRKVNVEDPASLYYRRPDLAAQAELNVKATLLRAGVTEQLETAESLARKQHEAAWPSSVGMAPAVADLIRERTEELTAQGDETIKRQAAELRERLGAQDYDKLVSEARESGRDVTPAATADLHSLKLLASRGR